MSGLQGRTPATPLDFPPSSAHLGDGQAGGKTCTGLKNVAFQKYMKIEEICFKKVNYGLKVCAGWSREK